MLFAGIDIGSTTSKCCLVDETGGRRAFSCIMTEFNRNVSGEKVLKEALKTAGASEAVRLPSICLACKHRFPHFGISRAYSDSEQIRRIVNPQEASRPLSK